MDTNQISAFIAVAESGSFSAAAERLHLTQPAVSKRIAVLEHLLGNTLFDRIGRRVLLTEAGKVLLSRAGKILREIEDTRTAMRNLSGSISGRLSLGASHHIGLHRLPVVLKEYAKGFPGATIDIAFLDSEKAYEQVSHGDIELAVVTLSPEPVEKIESRTVWFDELCFMTSADHPLAGSKKVRLKDLLDYPAILPARTTFTRQLVDKLFQQNRLRLDNEMSTNYLETIKMMVSVGMAWSVLPLSMLDDTLETLPMGNVSLQRKLGYVYHQDHTLSNAAKAFIRLLEQHRSRP